MRENILEACAFAHRAKDDKAKIASKLLIDSDKRFRSNFILGETAREFEDPDDDYESEDQEQEFDLDREDNPTVMHWARLDFCVARSYR